MYNFERVRKFLEIHVEFHQMSFELWHEVLNFYFITMLIKLLPSRFKCIIVKSKYCALSFLNKKIFSYKHRMAYKIIIHHIEMYCKNMYWIIKFSLSICIHSTFSSCLSSWLYVGQTIMPRRWLFRILYLSIGLLFSNI